MASPSAFTHTQAVASTSWVITHNFGRPPVVEVFVNHGGQVKKMMPLNIIHTNSNTLTVTFSVARTGGARLI